MAIFTRNAPVNLANPLNWNHPEAKGLQALWMALPNRISGYTVPNLANPNLNLAWTAISATTGWSGTTRPGGFAQFGFDGATSNAAVSGGDWQNRHPDPTVWGSNITECCWILMKANASGFDTFFAKSQNTYNNDLLVNSDNTVSFYFTLTGLNVITSTATLTVNKWYHIAGVKYVTDGGLAFLNLYINGNLEAANSFGDGHNSVGAGIWTLGYSGVFGRPFNGYVDDARVYGRALTQTDIRQVMQTSLRGYPGLINRIGPQVFSSSSAAKFRRTLSPVGTRVGSRQQQGI